MDGVTRGIIVFPEVVWDSKLAEPMVDFLCDMPMTQPAAEEVARRDPTLKQATPFPVLADPTSATEEWFANCHGNRAAAV